MKHLIAFLTVFFLSGLTATATTTKTLDDNLNSSSSFTGYGNSFIFMEEGIEFSIFPDGQFDFYMNNYGPNVNVTVGTPHLNISFNSGYDYNPYLQYDEFGAIIQIEHTPIYYDYFGRVSQIGNVQVNYNHIGFVSRVGGLNVFYNGQRGFSHCSGFINIYNRRYVYRPWHDFYIVPSFNHCVVYNRPYRQYYSPTRYSYTRPYANNYRRTSAVASRRGSKVVRHRDLATRNNNDGRRSNQLASNSRRGNNAISSNNGRRGNNQIASNSGRTRTNGRPVKEISRTSRTKPQGNSPRSNSSIKSKPRTKPQANSPRPIRSKPNVRTGTKSKQMARNTRKNVTKPNRSVSNKVRSGNSRVAQKPNNSRLRTYNKGSNSKKINRSGSKSNRRR